MLIYVSPPARAVRDLPLPATPEWAILRRNGPGSWGISVKMY